jgi:DNA-binding YbaB/EbfC family protein
MSKFNPLGSIMEQAQQLQERLSRLQEETAAKTVEAAAGGGMVSAKMNGKLELLELRIEPEAVKDGDVEMLQDLVRAAVNQAIRKAQDLMTEEMRQLTGGLKIPGLS